MSLTISLVQLKRKQRKDGTIPIYIRFTKGRKSRYKSTGIAVDSKHFNPEAKPDKKIRKSHNNYKVLNSELDRIITELKNKKIELRRANELSIQKIKKEISDEESDSLLKYGKTYRQQLNRDQRFWEHRHFGVVLNNLERFLDGATVKLDEVDADFLSDFQHFLLTEGGPSKKDGSRDGNSPNTVRRKLQRLKAMFNQARVSEIIEKDPFEYFEKVKPEPVEKTKLSPQQIEKIRELDLKRDSRLWHTRNYFMYSFFNAGIRFGDLCTLKWRNIVDGRLKYAMNKTGSHKNIKQLNHMQRILDYYRTKDTKSKDYIFPLLERKFDDPIELRKAISSKNVIINRNLKDLADEAGIQMNLSFHVSRHSFANYALHKGMDLYSISKALGHADLKITEQYLKSFDEEKLDEDMENIFN